MEVTYKKEFEVKVTRKIREGQTLRINPSEGYLGIYSGVIKVVAIGTQADMNDPSHDYESYAVEGVIPGHWVKYKYRNSDGGEEGILPLDLFVEHTMMY